MSNVNDEEDYTPHVPLGNINTVRGSSNIARRLNLDDGGLFDDGSTGSGGIAEEDKVEDVEHSNETPASETSKMKFVKVKRKYALDLFSLLTIDENNNIQAKKKGVMKMRNDCETDEGGDKISSQIIQNLQGESTTHQPSSSNSVNIHTDEEQNIEVQQLETQPPVILLRGSSEDESSEGDGSPTRNEDMIVDNVRIDDKCDDKIEVEELETQPPENRNVFKSTLGSNSDDSDEEEKLETEEELDTNDNDSTVTDGEVDSYNGDFGIEYDDFTLETQTRSIQAYGYSKYDIEDSSDEEDDNDWMIDGVGNGTLALVQNNVLPKEGTYEWYIMLLGRMLLGLESADQSYKDKFFDETDYFFKRLRSLLLNTREWYETEVKTRTHMRWLLMCFSDDDVTITVQTQSNKEILKYLATKYSMKNNNKEEWNASQRMSTTNKYYDEYCNAKAYIAVIQEYMKMYVMDGFDTKKRRSKKQVKEIMMTLEHNFWKKGLYHIHDEKDNGKSVDEEEGDSNEE